MTAKIPLLSLKNPSQREPYCLAITIKLEEYNPGITGTNNSSR